MKKQPKFILDFKNRKITFPGICTEVIDACQALCCRQWDLPISSEEAHNGTYAHDVVCTLTMKKCEKEKESCINRRYRLKKKKNGECLYLNHKHHCSIYETRPKNCRGFSCQEGWYISTPFPSGKKNCDKKINRFSKKYHNDMLFMLNPLIKLKTVFHSKERSEILLVKEPVSGCSAIAAKESFSNSSIDDKTLLFITNLFNGKNSVEDINNIIIDKYSNLTTEDLFEILTVLMSHEIIVFLK